MSDLRDMILGAIYGVEERKPYDSESEYFKKNQGVAGMAAEDDRVVLNPFSKLSPKELDAVRMNEAARVHMRKGESPIFDLTPEQSSFLDTTAYKDAQDAQRKSTIAARILSGDPSAGKATPQQMDYVRALRQRMGLK